MGVYMGTENVNCEIVMIEDVGRDITVLKQMSWGDSSRE